MAKADNRSGVVGHAQGVVTTVEDDVLRLEHDVAVDGRLARGGGLETTEAGCKDKWLVILLHRGTKLSWDKFDLLPSPFGAKLMRLPLITAL